MAFFPEKKGYSLKEFHEEYSKRLSKEFLTNYKYIGTQDNKIIILGIN